MSGLPAPPASSLSSESTPSPTSDEHGAAAAVTPTPVDRPHCWECRRRRLVCDGVQPVCTNCRTARIVCPGYADKKPLTWLAPGQVMSRTRRKKAPGLRKPANGGKKQQAKDPKPRDPKPRSPDTSTSLTSSDSSSEGPLESLANEWAARRARAQLPVEIRPEIFDMVEAMLYCTYFGYFAGTFPTPPPRSCADNRLIISSSQWPHLPQSSQNRIRP
jgi:hypothetical protein